MERASWKNAVVAFCLSSFNEIELKNWDIRPSPGYRPTLVRRPPFEPATGVVHCSPRCCIYISYSCFEDVIPLLRDRVSEIKTLAICCVNDGSLDYCILARVRLHISIIAYVVHASLVLHDWQ